MMNKTIPLLRYFEKENLYLLMMACVVFVVMAFFHLQTIPQPWFDEGWTLSVAKNWAEHGKYALRQGDEWVSGASMAQPFSVTFLVGISLRILGFGIKAARLPMIFLTIGCLVMLFKLSRQLYGRQSAWMTLCTVLFLAPAAMYNPLIFGRQTIGEIPMLFYLLAGYWFWGSALKGSKTSIVLAGLFWGLAILTKRQTLPFWLFSVFIVMFFSYFRKQLPVLFVTIASVLGTVLFLGLFQMVEQSLYSNFPTNGPPMQGLYALAGWTFNPKIRLHVLGQLPLFCLSSIFGLAYVFPRIRSFAYKRKDILYEDWLEISLFSLALSWFAWFVLGSLGWDRYYQPVFILTALFAGKFLVDSINQVSFLNLKEALSLVGPKKVLIPNLLLVVWLVLQSLFFEALTLRGLLHSKDPLAQQVAVYVNRNTDPDARIETYESELFFFLKRTYHYPPNQLQVQLNRREFLEEDISITYSPFESNPDYLIVGPIGNLWGLYDPFIQSGDFQLVREFSNYVLYQRVTDR